MWMESFNSWYTVNGYEWAFLTVSREMHDVTESSNTRHSLTILTNVWIETLPFCRRVVRSHDTLWWLHRSNGTTSCRFRLNMLSAWLRQTQWQYKWQVWYSHASLILHYAIFASCNGGWFVLRKVGFHISLLSLFWVWFWNWRCKVNAFQRYICKNDSKFNLICVSYLRVWFSMKSSEKKMANYRV